MTHSVPTRRSSDLHQTDCQAGEPLYCIFFDHFHIIKLKACLLQCHSYNIIYFFIVKAIKGPVEQQCTLIVCGPGFHNIFQAGAAEGPRGIITGRQRSIRVQHHKSVSCNPIIFGEETANDNESVIKDFRIISITVLQYTGLKSRIQCTVLIQHGNTYSRSEEHTSELQSLKRTSYAVFCLNKTNTKKPNITTLPTLSILNKQ